MPLRRHKQKWRTYTIQNRPIDVYRPWLSSFFSFLHMSNFHRHLRNIDCLSFVMCRLLALVLIVNRLLFFFFFSRCSHLQNYWSKQGRRYAPLSSLYYLDVFANFSLTLAICYIKYLGMNPVCLRLVQHHSKRRKRRIQTSNAQNSLTYSVTTVSYSCKFFTTVATDTILEIKIKSFVCKF